MAGERLNQTPRLADHLEGDYDGDFLGGFMAAIDTVAARKRAQEAVSGVEITIVHQFDANALHVIGADNIRGAAPKRQAVGKDDLRGNPQE